MTALAILQAVGAAFVEVLIAVHKAGDDRAQQEEALMLAAERLAELREKVKFG